jgi:hypothetical protein
MSHVDLLLVTVPNARVPGMLAASPGMTHLRGTTELMTQIRDA